MHEFEITLRRLNDAYFRNAPLGTSADGKICAHFRGNRITSVFQPVMSHRDGTTIGHVARIRADREGRPPASHWAVMALTGPAPLVVELDRMCRTLHALNYYPAAHASWRLFVRVQPRLIEAVGTGHGRVFEGILAMLGVPTTAVVIELPRDLNEDPSLFSRALLSYRGLGYKVAADCLDEEDPLLSGVYDVTPDVVTLDHRWVPGRAALETLTGRIHEVGAQAMVTHIENAEALETARGIGADLLQGYHLGMPASLPVSAVPRMSDSGTQPERGKRFASQP